MKLEPIADVKVGEQDGWIASGRRRDSEGHIVTEVIGVFPSWIDADQACDAYHAQHRGSLNCAIDKNYKKEER